VQLFPTYEFSTFLSLFLQNEIDKFTSMVVKQYFQCITRFPQNYPIKTKETVYSSIDKMYGFVPIDIVGLKKGAGGF